MMRYSLLAILYLLPWQILAQGDMPNTLSYWHDDQNIRLHTTYLLGNMRGDGTPGPTHWDSSRQSYISTIPELMRYPAIAKRGYRQALVQAVAVPYFHYYTARTAERSALDIARTLDSFIKHFRSYESFKLTYTRDGYLRRATHKKADKKGRYTQWDTANYTYKQIKNGDLIISCKYDERTYEPLPGYQSVWCGTISKGPLTLTGHNRTIYDIDSNGRLRSRETGHSAYANDCRNYTPDRRLVSIRYNEKGRVTAMTDSSITHRGRNMLTEIRYEEMSAAALSDSAHNYRIYKALRLPLISKWLAGKTGLHYQKETTTQTIYTEYSDKKHIQAITGKPPKIVSTEEVVLYDDHENMLMKVEHHYSPNGFLMYQYGQDSGGTYRGRYGTTGIPAPDTGTYQPNRTGNIPYPETIYIRHPTSLTGVIQTPSLDYNERNISPKTQGWQIISYERELDGYSYNNNSEPYYFWSPAGKRLATTHPPFTHLIVVGPDGLCRFVYDQGTLYKITYR